MAGNKYSSELLLQGKFEFDQNSLSAAAQFTQELVKTIEGPLQEMTQRIVSNLFGRQGLGQGFQSAQFSQPGFQVQSTFTGQSMPGFGQVSPTFREYLGREGRALEEGYGEIKQRAFGSIGTPYSPHFEAANMARMMQKAQKAGVDVYSTLSEEQRGQFREAAITKSQQISELTGLGLKEQAEYTQKIKEKEDLAEKAKAFYQERLQRLESSGASSDFVAQKRTEFEDKLVAIQQESLNLQRKAQDAAEKTASGIQELKTAKEALEAPEAARDEAARIKRSSMIQLGIMGMGAAGQALAFAGRVPGEMRAMEADRAALAGMGTRMLMAGDLSGYAAMQNIGGQEAVQARGLSETRLQGAGSVLMSGAGAAGGAGLLGSLLTGAGMGGAGGMIGGPLGMLAAGLVGAGVAGYQYYAHSDAQQRANAQKQIEDETNKNREYYDGLGRARQRSIRAFEISSGLGDRSLEGMLAGITNMGAGRTGQLMGSVGAIGAAEKEAISRSNLQYQKEIGGEAQFDSATGQMRLYTAEEAKQRRADREKAIREKARQQESEVGFEYKRQREAGGFAATGESLSEYAARLGVDYAQMAPIIGQLGQKSQGAGIMESGINLASLGIGADVQSQLLASGPGRDPRAQFALIKDMYIDVFASGIEKSHLPRAIEGFASIASQIGLGGSAVAREQLARSTRMAGDMFGEGYTGTQLDFAKRAERFAFGGGPVFSGGLANALGIGAIGQQLSGARMGEKSLSQVLGANAGIVAALMNVPGQNEESMKEILKTYLPDSEKNNVDKWYQELGGARGLAATRQQQIAKDINTGIGKSAYGLIAMANLGVESGEQITSTLKLADSVLAGATEEKYAGIPMLPKTPEEKEAFDRSLRRAGATQAVERGAAPTGQPGETAVKGQLQIDAAAMATAFSSLSQSLPDFAKAVEKTNAAIAQSLEELEKKRSSSIFGF